MAKSALKILKDKLAVKTRVKKVFIRQGSSYLVISSFLSLVFFSLAFFIFLPLLKRDSDILRLLVVLYSAFLIFWALGVVYEYFIKSSRLLVNLSITNYSILSGINTVIGFAFPIFVINSVLSIVISALSNFKYAGSALCEIRMVLVRFYYSSNFYNQVASLVFWIVVISLITIIFGSLLERLIRLNKEK